eukprot:jgi/Chrzof1/6600/Cz19g02070.t1_PPD2[v5.2]
MGLTIPVGTSIVIAPSASAAETGADSPAATTSSPADAVLQQYVNDQQRYRLRVPVDWDRKDKAGADVLFEDPNRRSTSVGITVSPVRVVNIQQFGTLEDVGRKLLEAEKKKESTLGVQLLSQSSRTGAAGATLYDYEYELDSTRGLKHIVNTVTITGSRLYILNGTVKCEKEGYRPGKYSTFHTYVPTDFGAATASATAYSAKSIFASAGAGAVSCEQLLGSLLEGVEWSLHRLWESLMMPPHSVYQHHIMMAVPDAQGHDDDYVGRFDANADEAYVDYYADADTYDADEDDAYVDDADVYNDDVNAVDDASSSHAQGALVFVQATSSTVLTGLHA